MRFDWVRYVEQDGSWGDGSVHLRLKSSRLAAAGYFTVLSISLAVLAWPLAAAAGAGLHVAPAVGPVGAAKLLVLGALTAAFLGWLAFCCFRSTVGSASVQIDGDRIDVCRRGIMGSRITSSRTADYEGVAVLPVTTLGGRLAQLYLVHADRKQSVLLGTDLTISRDTVTQVSRALGVQIIGEQSTKLGVAQVATESPTALAA